MRTEKGTFHSCTLCGTFPGLSSGPATRSPQSHCRFQGLEPVGCHRTRICTTCLPQETYRLLRCPCAVEPSCLEYLDCRSSGQDLPLVLRGETTSHIAFLPGISQAPSQLRGTAGLWGDRPGAVASHRDPGVCKWRCSPSTQVSRVLAGPLSICRTQPNHPRTHKRWVPAPQRGVTHRNQQKL